MAENEGKDNDDLKDIVEDIESLGILNKTDFEDMEIMHEDETFATMVEENISDEEMDELTKAFQNLEEKISVPSAAESFASMELDEGEFGGMSEDDLDAMLKSLMEDNEEEEEAWVPIEDIDAHLEEEPEIYEGDSANSEIDLSILEGEKGKLSKSPHKWLLQQYRSGDQNTKKLILAITGMSGLVAASLLFLVGVLIASNFSNQEQGVFNVSPPSYAFNNASHSIVSLAAPLGDDTIILNRILLDEVVTSFYFSGSLDPARYIFTLEDFNGRTYNRNISLAANPARDQTLSQTVVRFEAMDPNAEGFVISIKDLNTGQSNAIELVFDEGAIAPGRHIAAPIEVDVGLSGVTISIDHSTFSAAASSLNFSISYSNPNISLVFVENAVAPPVNMRHMGATVPPIGTLQITDFPQDRITLGAIDFSPLRSLTGRVDIVFGHMYKHYEMNTTMPTTGMFTANEDRARILELDDHIITIHGLMRQGDFFVMPLYGVPKTDDEDEEAPRVPTTMNVALYGTNDLGRLVRLPGTVMFDARGTDVIFDTRENEAILDIPISQLYLEFESISVRLPDFVATIDLDKIGFEPSSDTAAVKSAIESSFEQDMQQFVRQFGASQNVDYTAQVRQLHIEGNTAYAKVFERLAFTDGGSLQEVMRHHRVTANILSNNIAITNSVIELTEQRP